MKHLTLLLFLLTSGMVSPVRGQEGLRRLSLGEAIEIAQAQSPDALKAKQTFQTSYWEWRSYKASNLPALSFDAVTPRINQSIQSQSVGGVQSYESYKYIYGNGNLSLSQKIGITGGEISVNSSLEGTYNVDKENSLPWVSAPVNIEFRQPLFKYNKMRWDRKIMPVKYQEAKKKYIEDMESVSITVANHFFNLLQAQVEKKIASINLYNYDTLYRIAKGRYQLGKIAENELLQLELNFLKAQAATENADLSLDNAMFRLKSYLRLQDSTRIVLVPPGNIDFFKINPLTAIELAKTNSSSYSDFQRRLLEAASELNNARLTGRFDADIYALIGLNQQGSTVKDAYVNPADRRQFSLNLSVPIVDWGVAHGKIKMAQSQEDIVKNLVEQDAIDFERNVYLKVVQFNMQQNQVMIAAKSDTVARKSFEVTKGRYLIGKMNDITTLNLAQVEMDNSEKSYYYALQTFWTSFYEIRRMTHYDFRKNEPIGFTQPDFK